jgi:type IV pilus modification protein PilV
MKSITKSFVERKSEQGFTLIEFLVAVIILTVGLLAVGSMQISAIRGNFLGGNTSIALSLASERMEDLLNKNIGHLDLVDTAAANNANLTSITTCDHQERVNEAGTLDLLGFYRRIWNVADSASPALKSITVIVTWENDRHRVSISSLKQQ